MFKELLRDFEEAAGTDSGDSSALKDFWREVPFGMFAYSYLRRSPVHTFEAIPWLKEHAYIPFLHSALGDLVLYNEKTETFVAYNRADNRFQECGVLAEYVVQDFHNPFFQREMLTPEPYEGLLNTNRVPGFWEVSVEGELKDIRSFYRELPYGEATWR